MRISFVIVVMNSCYGPLLKLFARRNTDLLDEIRHETRDTLQARRGNCLQHVAIRVVQRIALNQLQENAFDIRIVTSAIGARLRYKIQSVTQPAFTNNRLDE